MTTVETPAHPRIAIIGGGPAGLVLLLTLHRRGIPATLYERDEGFSARSHLGGTLDLSWERGQRALRENGLQEIFNQNSRPDGDEYRFCDSQATLLMFRRGEEARDPTKIRPEIDRSVLRKLLLDAVPADSIKWDHSLQSVRALEGGQHALTFSNGATTVCDLLVGADGGRSHVRPLVSPASPIYAGASGAELSLTPEVATSPEMADIRELIGNGALFCVEKGQTLGAQVNGDGRIHSYAWLPVPEGWALPQDTNEARKYLLETYTGWDARLLKLIQHCDDEAMYTRAIYYLPIGHKWEHVPGVTLLGDAAHLMSPFAGAGANLAMLDGLELGLALSESITRGDSAAEREAAIAAWEPKMFAEAEKEAIASKMNLDSCLHPDAPHHTMERLKALKDSGFQEQ